MKVFSPWTDNTSSLVGSNKTVFSIWTHSRLEKVEPKRLKTVLGQIIQSLLLSQIGQSSVLGHS